MSTYFIRQKGAAFVVVALLVLFAAACVTDPGAVLVSLRQAGTTADGLDYGVEDIIAIMDEGSGPEWFTFFDGSEHGLTPKHSINAFSFNEVMWTGDTAPIRQEDLLDIPELYLTFRPNSIHVPGISGRITGNDVIKYTETDANDPGTFELLFDGSDVGLTTRTEKIDGLGFWAPETLPEPEYSETCPAGIFFITTQGLYRVPGAEGGQIVGSGFDVLLFCATITGPSTAGYWYRVFNNRDYDWFAPGRASTSLDVIGFQLMFTASPIPGAPPSLAPEPDLSSGIDFLFTPRTDFVINGLPGYTFETNQLFEIDTITNYPDIDFYGPYADFETGEDFYESTTFPPVNGLVQSVSIWDSPFAP